MGWRFRAAVRLRGERRAAECGVPDHNGDGEVAIDELIRGVNAALLNCAI
ncbi:MAG TPA: hypothetical protein VL049_08080 [Candidatus Dormibacteraeota bacterium]|nr:hypothetical protein [Candidatus Dormibacteraeota bacterium]